MNPYTNITYQELNEFYDNKLVTTKNSSVDEITEWCDDQSIEAHFVGQLRHDYIWYVIKDDDRTMFTLRWTGNDNS